MRLQMFFLSLLKFQIFSEESSLRVLSLKLLFQFWENTGKVNQKVLLRTLLVKFREPLV